MAQEQKKKQKEINVNRTIIAKMQEWTQDNPSGDNVLATLLATFFKISGYIRLTTTILGDFLKEFDKNYDKEILPNIDKNKAKQLQNLKGFTKVIFRNLLNDSLKELIEREEKNTMKSMEKKNNDNNNNNNNDDSYIGKKKKS